MSQDLNRHFSKEDVQRANVERCFVSSVIKEMQIKTTMRYHLTPIRIAIKKNVQEDVVKSKHLYAVGKSINWCSHLENSMKVSQKMVKMNNFL